MVFKLCMGFPGIAPIIVIIMKMLSVTPFNEVEKDCYIQVKSHLYMCACDP